MPVRLEGFSYKGLRETIDTLLYIKDEHDIESIKFGGAFITQAEINTNIYKALKSNYTDELGGRFYETPIRKDIHISELKLILPRCLSIALIPMPFLITAI